MKFQCHLRHPLVAFSPVTVVQNSYTKGMRDVLRNLDLTAGQGLHRQPAGSSIKAISCWNVQQLVAVLSV